MYTAEIFCFTGKYVPVPLTLCLICIFQHDDRDGEKTWVDNRGRGRGSFPTRRGRFVYRKGGSSPKWTHDMFQGGEEGELGDDNMEMEHKETKSAGDASAQKQ